MDVWLVTLFVLIVIGLGFYSLLKNRLKSGGGSATVLLGATDQLLNEDKKRAAQEIVQEQAREIRHISETDNAEGSKSN